MGGRSLVVDMGIHHLTGSFGLSNKRESAG
jgi:hypothetical protein